MKQTLIAGYMIYIFCHHDLNDTITIMIILKEILVLVELFLFFYLMRTARRSFVMVLVRNIFKLAR